jgi:Arc/MetJ-type ribon-helix-helix transcriptional regulator
MEVGDELQGKVTRIPITFPDELYEWLRQVAFERRVSMAEVVRGALRDHRREVESQLDLWGAKR